MASKVPPTPHRPGNDTAIAGEAVARERPLIGWHLNRLVLVDTSVWIDLFRDASGSTSGRLVRGIGDHEVVLSRFQQFELLQGCRNEHEWSLLGSYLESQEYLEMGASSWSDAARTFYDLHRVGLTVRSPIDCCIVQIALDHDILLLHRDHDFETISQIRPLRQVWVEE